MISVSCVTEKNSGDVMSAPHCHSTIEVDCILDGNGRYSVAGAVHDIAAGDVFVFSNNIIHRITSIAPDRAMKILKVHFSPSLLMQEGLFSLSASDIRAEAVAPASGSWQRTIPGGSSGSTTALCPVGSRVYLAISGETKLHWVRV